MPLTAGGRDRISAVCLALICGATLWNEAWREDRLWPVIALSFAVFLSMQWRRLPLICHVLIGIAAAVAGLLALKGELTTTAVAEAISRAGFFAFFLTCLAWLAASARSSPVIHRCGMAALEQPPSRRYAVLTLAGHLLGFLLLASAGGLLGAAVRAGTTQSDAAPDAEVNAIRRRRMTTAITRGAGTIVLWTPTSLIAGALLTVIPDLRWSDFFLPGVVLAVLALSSGVAFDWLTRPRALAGRVRRVSGNLRGLRSFGSIIFLIVTIFAMGHVLEAVSSLRQIVALLCCAFLVAIGWLIIQSTPEKRFREAAARMRRDFVPIMAEQRAEVGLFGAAGVVGALIVHLQSPETTERVMASLGLGGAGTLIAASWLILLLGQVGISPIITVSVMAEPLWHLPSLETALLPLLFSILVPAAVFSFTSSFSVIVRLTAVSLGEPARTVGLKWNWIFGILLMGALNFGVVLST